MSGRVVHFEIPYDDGDRARGFYEKAFGWNLMSLPDMGYTMVMSGPSGDQGPTEAGFINGGMMQRQEPFTAPNIVIDVDEPRGRAQGGQRGRRDHGLRTAGRGGHGLRRLLQGPGGKPGRPLGNRTFRLTHRSP